MRTRRSLLLSCSTAAAIAFAFLPPPQRGGAQATAPVVAPASLVTVEGEGPALFLGAQAGAPAVGYLSPDVEVELAGPLGASRVLVRIRGAMRVRAHVPLERLAGRVQRRGRLRGTPAYLAGGDLVRVLGLEADGRVRVSARVLAGGRALDYVGSFPAVGLGARAPAEGPETVPPGTRATLRATAPVNVRDPQTGATLATLSPGIIRCRMVQREPSGSYSVLIGTGPYLAGLVDQEPIADDLTDIGPTGTGHTGHAIPARLRVDEHLPLVRLASGTRVTFDGQTVAVLDEPGMARIVERFEASGEADAFVAVDDRVAVRGIIPLTAITAESPAR